MAGARELHLVSGAAGLLGANLVRVLGDRGLAVRAMVRHDRRALEGLSGVELVRADLLEPESLGHALRDVSHVHHCAARISMRSDDDSVQADNVQGTQNLLRASMDQGIARFVQVSSIDSLAPAFPGAPLDGKSLSTRRRAGYGYSKALADQALAEAARQGLSTATVVPSAIVGPHDHKPSALGRVLRLAFRGWLPIIPDGGFDFVDARDVAQIMVFASRQGPEGGRYIASGGYCSLADLVTKIQALRGRALPPLRFSLEALYSLTRRLEAHWPAWTGHPQLGSGALGLLRGLALIDPNTGWTPSGIKARPLLRSLEDIWRWSTGPTPSPLSASIGSALRGHQTNARVHRPDRRPY